MDENMQNMQISARSNRQSNKSGRDFADSTGDLGMTLQEHLKLTRFVTVSVAF